MKKISLIILFVFVMSNLYSQKVPERSDMRKGNKLYNENKYTDAETAYRRGLQKNPESKNAKYNLANSIYKQERYEDAAKLYKELAQTKIDSTQPPQTYHNLGNAMLKQAIKDKETQGQHVAANQEQLKESIEAYKKALKLNPDDMETKSNLAYAQKLLAKNGGGGGGNNNQQQQQNQDKDKNQDENQNNDDKQSEDKQNQDKQNQDKQDRNENQSQDMSKQDIERMLDAVRAQEEQTKEKVDKEKAAAARKGTPEKNW
ncbi:MAG: tetratricopeptide repeat protein [Prevotellaceae bacterium]|jgi:tetratricopeptide (TPR) repeat protein|nr:tetratricopeptide repeat protein [Prevotellaceae bacterium]